MLKRSMGRLLAFAVLMALFTTAVKAQTDPDAPPQHRQGGGGGDRLARMQRNLGLTDDQVRQIREIRERGGSREEIREVLTEEQRLMMQERRRQAQERKRQGHAQGGNQPGRYYLQPDNEPAPDSDGN